ncbi:MAG: response regulator [Verrucomicrobiaceae bacterium]|nr:MAG: response regulator [Verrucomicrobiaceae bacterium]
MGLNVHPSQAPVVPSLHGEEVPSRENQRYSNVLLVDDSKFLADILTMFFQLDGYTARAAYGGRHAIELIEDEVPDIAFLDIDMPDIDGLQLAKHIRESKRACGTTLVALSGWDEEPNKQKAREAGFDHFISKPVEAPAIREFMKKLEEEA